MTDDAKLARARELLNIEAKAIEDCASRLGKEFLDAIGLIKKCREERNKLVFMGMGKSHYVAGKLAASFMSMGTTAVFLHPAEAFHGDLGGIRPGDLCILISKSGSTPELLGLLPFLKEHNKVIAITGNMQGPLSIKADYCLDASVEKEACPINMLPTASTTAALAIGDALVSVLAEELGFDKKTFAGYHPGGSIGKRLNQCIADVMLPLSKVPTGDGSETLKDIASRMSALPIGAFCVVDNNELLKGIFTDGDLKRVLSKGQGLDTQVKELMCHNPTTLSKDLLIEEALGIMEQADKKVNCSPVVDKSNKLIGFVRLHDLI